MASSLTFTSTAFASAVQLDNGESINTEYEILASDATYVRRIYGISCTSTDAGAQTVKLFLHNGTSSFQIFTVNIPLNSGNSATVAAVDIMGSIYGSSILQKQRDANGVPYFNIPNGWKITASFGTALGVGEVLNFIVFGETYGA